jgi:hypothetical protein
MANDFTRDVSIYGWYDFVGNITSSGVPNNAFGGSFALSPIPVPGGPVPDGVNGAKFVKTIPIPNQGYTVTGISDTEAVPTGYPCNPVDDRRQFSLYMTFTQADDSSGVQALFACWDEVHNQRSMGVFLDSGNVVFKISPDGTTVYEYAFDTYQVGVQKTIAIMYDDAERQLIAITSQGFGYEYIVNGITTAVHVLNSPTKITVGCIATSTDEFSGIDLGLYGWIQLMILWGRYIGAQEMINVCEGKFNTLLPANNFEYEPNCQAHYPFNWEIGRIYTDIQKTNDLTFLVNPGFAKGLYAKMGPSSVYSQNNIIFYRNDSDLANGFPFKSNDTIKQMSFCGWFMCESMAAPNTEQIIFAKFENNGSLKVTFCQEAGGIHRIFLYRRYYDADLLAYVVEQFDMFDIIGMTIDLQQYYHLSVMYEDDTGQLMGYLWDQGREVNRPYGNIFSNQIAIGNGPLTIGGDSAGNNQFTGLMNDFIFFNRILTEVEIIAIRNGTFKTPRPPIPANFLNLLQQERRR